ncbi:N-acetylneuraminate lyase isoform X2 [Aethina tumida]|nr:N-acetylneuraminate lyase isoform X2 [Aethina tumida]
MTVAERKLVTEAWVKAVKETKQHLMIQVGGAPLPDVLELARHAEKLGVDSLLCLPELYFKPTTPAELTDYLKLVGDAAPKTPLLYYHIPMFTNVNVHMGQFLEYVAGKIPNFRGIKFTSNNLDEGMQAVKANNGQFAVFLGADTLLAGALALGFDSAIATSLNIFPQYSVQIMEACKASRLEEAKKTQEKLTAACSIITKNGGWVPTMKVAMNVATPINVGMARAPLKNLTQQHILEMKQSLSSFL